MNAKLIVIGCASFSLLLGCAPAPYQYYPQPTSPSPLVNIPARQYEANKLTLGTIQMVVKKGVSGNEIISSLGSPNIITTDETGGETWVYDKVSRESESTNNGRDSVAVNSSRTLTVVIRFDKAKKVRDFAYHSSSF